MTLPGGEPMLAVFVPGLMGAGILVSGGILLTDGIRKLMPNRGVRRQVVVARGVRGVVAGVARAAGLEVGEGDLFQRDLRWRWAYLALGLALIGVAAVIIRAGVAAFVHHGTLHGNPWSIGLGLGLGIPSLLAGGLALTITARYRRSPGSLLRLVHRTWLGRLRPLPEDPRERSLALIPVSRGEPARVRAMEEGDAT
ncbi:MAG: hypothetical protein HYU54_10140 [Actinobacteria bacterium]|nr:hypothetical protein [Actinomycetota bacterium]